MTGRDVPAGPARVDVSYGGAIYASVPASSVGLTVSPSHPDSRLSGIYGTIFCDDLGDTPSGPHQRSVTIFADGQIDRSPCGSGTSARLALLAADGRLPLGAVLTHDSIATEVSGNEVGSGFVLR